MDHKGVLSLSGRESDEKRSQGLVAPGHGNLMLSIRMNTRNDVGW
jgi:hypothetical protein